MKNDLHDVNFIKIHISKTGAVVLSGALIAAVSAVGAIRSVSGKNEGSYNFPLLLGSVAGMALGTALILEPGIRARRGAEVEELFDEQDVENTDRHINEVLNKNVERGEQQTAHCRKIEVDEETSIEDFI